MKNVSFFKIIKLLSFAILLVHLTTSFIIAAPYTLLTLTTHNLPPYGSFPDGSPAKKIADGTFTGVAVDRIRCVLQKIDVPVEIEVYPWKRAQFLVQQGDADGFFAASQKLSRDEYATLTGSIADQKWTWYLLKENPLDPQQDDFRKKATVAGFSGANMLSWMQEEGYNVQNVPKDTAALLKVLLSKRVDAVMANNYVMDALLEKQGLKGSVKSYVSKDKPLSVYISKHYLDVNPGFIEEFNSHISECK